jgi:thioredoxin 1
MLRTSFRAIGGVGRAANMMRFYSGVPQGKVVELTKLDNFRKFIDNGDKVTVIDFYAQWCGPCKMLEPIFATLSEKIPEVQFGRVDVDTAEDIAQEYAITAMPTCILFQKGDKLDTIVGANPPKLVQLIQTHAKIDFTKR